MLLVLTLMCIILERADLFKVGEMTTRIFAGDEPEWIANAFVLVKHKSLIKFAFNNLKKMNSVITNSATEFVITEFNYAKILVITVMTFLIRNLGTKKWVWNNLL